MPYRKIYKEVPLGFHSVYVALNSEDENDIKFWTENKEEMFAYLDKGYIIELWTTFVGLFSPEVVFGRRDICKRCFKSNEGGFTKDSDGLYEVCKDCKGVPFQSFTQPCKNAG